MTQTLTLGLITLVASMVGTATGFGTSTIMVPILSLWLPLPITLLFVGIVHLCGDVWKVVLFKSGLDWKLVLGFGIPGIAASYLGASLSFSLAEWPLKRILGLFIFVYAVFLLGNSPDVAKRHYLQTHEEHFKRAAGDGRGTEQRCGALRGIADQESVCVGTH